MKTRKTKTTTLKSKSFKNLKTSELIKIKGGGDKWIGGTPTQKDGSFD